MRDCCMVSSARAQINVGPARDPARGWILAMKMVVVVVGTRPEAIKLAPLILRWRGSRDVRCHVLLTGQHRGLLDQALADFGIEGDTDLDLMRPGQTLAGLTARAVEALDGRLGGLAPALVVVQGDTTSAMCAALAAFYRRIPVAHVEAGLRTGDLEAPWPEEANRALIGRLASLHFAPTTQAREALLREGIAPERIHVTGNTAIDALLLILARSPDREKMWVPEGRSVLVTVHRREHFGERLESVVRAVAELAARYPDVSFVCPVHPNPRVRDVFDRVLTCRNGDHRKRENVQVVEPLPYPRFVRAMLRASLILTDSGGIQEEAPSLGTPVLVLRDATERPEALETGIVSLVGTEPARILHEASRWLDRPSRRRATAVKNPFGDGRAAVAIAAVCEEFLRQNA